MTNKNTVGSRITRQRDREKGLKEIRGIKATEEEEAIIKPLVRKLLKLLRGDYS